MKKSLIFLLVLITSITLYASDVILSNTLGAYYCSQEPNPKTYIKHTVEEPISIYWEDNVYPGFDEADSKLMVANYLDGVHLQTMALNTPDGKVRVYSYANVPQSYIDLVKEGYAATKEWTVRKAASSKAFEEAYDSKHGKYKDGYSRDSSPLKELSAAFREIDAKKSALTKQIEVEKAKLDLVITETTRDQMPHMNYTVKTDEVHFSELAYKVIYSDEVKITDNRTAEIIAYNRRIMQLFSTSLLPDFQGGNYYVPKALCGNGTEVFERGIFTTLKRGTSRKLGPNGGRYAKSQKTIGEK
ncbi:MAG: hypothetical protein PHQ22_10200 [Sulfuricurvum sp.]|nr:hypothetical protein [Sulfuricurvum sp.]MDD5387551.1 hypothetical protein [Sulfuricurvum sp.]